MSHTLSPDFLPAWLVAVWISHRSNSERSFAPCPPTVSSQRSAFRMIGTDPQEQCSGSPFQKRTEKSGEGICELCNLKFPTVSSAANFPTERPHCVVYHLSGATVANGNGRWRGHREMPKTSKAACRCRVIIGWFFTSKQLSGKLN